LDTTSFSSLKPYKNFTEASQAVLEFLHERFGFALWLVTRTEQNEQIILSSEGHTYGVGSGDVLVWSESFCAQMVGGAPHIAPNTSEVAAYVAAPVGQKFPVQAYIGIPLLRADGNLFGTLCAYDPKVQPELIREEQALVENLGRLLSTLLDYDLQAQTNARELEKVKAEAHHDGLTGLFNQTAWLHLIAAEEERATRYGHSLSVALFDLDSLKYINDTQGHSAGDKLLKHVAEVLKSSVRASDSVARIGGDEFAILLPETPKDELEAMLKRIAERLINEGLDVSIGFSVRKPKLGIEKAIEAADAAMYQDKKRRKAKPLIKAK